ncbi:MAG TPA: hypothetical protein VM428_07800 [Microlunatus sp.]|nr:hypothetical protein [Microlunatus sp.]
MINTESTKITKRREERNATRSLGLGSGTVAEHVGAIVTAMRKPFDQASGILVEAHGILGKRAGACVDHVGVRGPGRGQRDRVWGPRPGPVPGTSLVAPTDRPIPPA